MAFIPFCLCTFVLRSCNKSTMGLDHLAVLCEDLVSRLRLDIACLPGSVKGFLF